MREIITVLGVIEPKDLGFCQCHEHLLIQKGQSFKVNPALCIDDVSKSLAEVMRYKAAGGHSLFDAQPGGCGRMTLELADISAKSRVNILAATGFHKLIFYPENHWIHTASADMLAELFIAELERGMFTDMDSVLTESHCSYRAGFIKTALDTEGLTPRYVRLFKAAANAAKAADKNIMIHVEQNADPSELLHFLLKQDVNPARLIFCHMDRACADWRLHLEVLRHRCYLEYDTIGRFKYHSDEWEISLIKALLQAGYEKQLLYSLDTTRARLKSYDKSAVGLDYILTTFNNLLLNAGITQREINLFSTKNCVKALTE